MICELGIIVAFVGGFILGLILGYIDRMTDEKLGIRK